MERNKRRILFRAGMAWAAAPFLLAGCRGAEKTPERLKVGVDVYKRQVFSGEGKEKDRRVSKMIYISHLLPDEEMREVIEKTGAGVESIEFSIAENLDRLEDSISSYKKRIRNMGAENLILHGPFLDLSLIHI